MLTSSGICCIRETKTKTDELVTFILAGGFGIPDVKFIESSSDADMRKALWDEDCRAGILLYSCFNFTHALLILHSSCTHTLLVLYSCFTHALLMLSSYFTHALLMLYAYTTHAVLMLQSCFAPLILYSCSTHALLMLYSYFTHHSRTAASSYFPAVEGHAGLRPQRCQRHARIRITRHAPQVYSYYYICVPIHYMCHHTTCSPQASLYYYTCPHTTHYMCPHTPKCTAAVLILLCTWHQTTTYVSSY